MAKNNGALDALENTCREQIAAIDGLKAERRALNAKMEEVRSTLEAAGIPRAALSFFQKYMSYPKEVRESIDIAYAFLRQATEEPLQSTFDFGELVAPAQEEAGAES